ncbi:ribulose-bisphosphate carboxylase large subunit family protein [Herbaspirillum lusitanum]|jgi:ribulose-bisphosphate carboxylase large chain|uniref:Ribulose-bisphosphate carboxylase large subunit family protein n=1 Tax=Herbaspirillum lusitanum TaxID=213312 RepID=A0ABW9ADX3_9BURK
MTNQRIKARYRLQTTGDGRRVAEVMAGEQSSGTFIAIPGESAELKERSAARVEHFSELQQAAPAPLPGAVAGELRTYEMELSWPVDNLGLSLTNLLATVAGNLFELKQVAGLKILDIDLPDAFAAAYPGPGFGVAGTRQLSGVEGRPLIGTIIKPSVGLSAAETAALVDQLCEGGIDFIKDDELQGDGYYCSFEDRARAVMEVIERHAQRSGKKVMFAFNLTGELDEMQRRHDLVESLGGTCVMLSLNSVGLTGFNAFRKHCRLPIHAHRNGWGYLGRSEQNGWSYVAWQKIWRLAGVDHMHVNGLSNKFWEPDDSVIASARACSTPMFSDKSCAVMPVFSSGQSAKQIPATYQMLQSPDFLYCAGGGIVAHPAGIAAGVRALRQSWDAARDNIALATAAQSHAELKQALETFGS